ncbi:MAG TPA: WecB/TagA/CpsF family glycosyltransferase [Planctomycetota bacterium]|nr:WecB/TagA/CpsF family glycosyltransferase [Planctomycetota bacterium]
MSQISHLPILGTRIASVTYDEALSFILELAARDPRAHGYVCATNVHTVSMARRDPAYREVLNGAILSVPDGKPLVWAHRILGGRRLPDRVYGPTLMLKLCEAAAERGFPVYLYGGQADVPRHLAEVLCKHYPKLQIAGAYSPPFGERDYNDPGLLAEIDAINKSGARLIFVALGAPRQEIFMARNASRIEGIQLGVGAAFDFHTRRVAQAPEWLQDAGLEWLFRFCCEPRRLWRRYLFYNPYFVARLALQRFGFDEPSRELARRLAENQGGNGRH